MTSFGRFETVREIHRSGFNLLYSGRTKTDLEVKFAIKVFQPSTFLLESEQIKTESDLFLNSALVQQKTVAGGAGNPPANAHMWSDGGTGGAETGRRSPHRPG